MPKFPVTRKQADQMGRAALKALASIARFVASVARSGAHAIRQAWRVVDAVPAAVRLFVVAGVLMLLGVVGAIVLHNSLG